MKSKGFDVTNDPFQKHAKEFRDALALAQAPSSYHEQTSKPLTEFFNKLVNNINKDNETEKTNNTISKKEKQKYYQYLNYYEEQTKTTKKQKDNDLEL